MTTTVPAADITAAIDAWKAVIGTGSSIVSGLSSLVFEVADLSSTDPLMLARSIFVGGVFKIQIDNNAAGYGWNTGSGAPAAGTIDLRTVLAHEIGHVLGLSHSDPTADVMKSTLAPATRVLPVAADKTEVLAVDRNQLANGLDTFGDWSENLGTSISNYFQTAGTLPFSNETIFQAMGLDTLATSLGAQIHTQIDAHSQRIGGLLQQPERRRPDTTDLIASVNANAQVIANKITIGGTGSNTMKEFTARLVVAKFHSDVDLSLDGLNLDFLNDLGLPSVNLGLKISQSHPLSFDADLVLEFTFGLEGDDTFFVADPNLNAPVTFGDRPLDIVGIAADGATGTSNHQSRGKSRRGQHGCSPSKQVTRSTSPARWTMPASTTCFRRSMTRRRTPRASR